MSYGIAQSPHGHRAKDDPRTEIVRSPCGDRPSHGARAGIVQCHLRHVYGPTVLRFFQIVKLLAKPNRRGRGARESVRKSLSRPPASAGRPRGGPPERGYGQDTGSVDPSQAKCELDITDLPRRRNCTMPVANVNTYAAARSHLRCHKYRTEIVKQFIARRPGQMWTRHYQWHWYHLGPCSSDFFKVKHC